MIRFRSLHSTPPQGVYEYELDGVLLQDSSRFGICAKVRELRTSKGLRTIGDGFDYIMDYMCRHSLPDGFCDRPSTVKVPRVQGIKAATVALFGMRLVPSDVAERRLIACISCPQHTRRGVCINCTGLLDWVRRGMPGRGVLPADSASGACLCDGVLAAASVSVAGRPLTDGAEYPANCWRKHYD